jgi:isoquinoline 1-oxidoreductase beta subunit
MPKAVPMRGAGYERLREVPKIEVEIIPSNDPPGGVSGLGMAVLAPAVANAIAAGTGRRLRNLPFDPMAA